VTSLLDLLTSFAAELRAAGVPVSMAETLDAVAATAQTPLARRQAVRHALRTTLIKDQAHQDAFDLLFDIYFAPQIPLAEPAPEPGPGPGARPAQSPGPQAALRRLSAAELESALVAALLADDRAAISAVAGEAVTRYGGVEPSRPVTGRYYVHRTLGGLHFDGLAGRLAAAAGPAGPGPGGPGPGGVLGLRLDRAEHAGRLNYLRGQIEAEVRRRLVAAQGARAVAGITRQPLPQDVEFLRAAPADLEALRVLLEPLGRRLAGRLRQRGQRGALDVRSTVRHSLSYGGVPAEPRFRARRLISPEIMVVADVSGSVAAFAGFTLVLMSSVMAQFRMVRSFVFIDSIDEVTRLLGAEARAESIAATAARVNREARVVSVDGHSDYGRALESLWQRWGGDVTARTTVLVLGDARNNQHPPQARALRALSARARHVFWLNPEPRSLWDTGDSVMAQYAPHCDAVVECRNFRQLGHFVERLL
jgi:uncharacterized protein with von Willebrand factor type A (vWA) domain